MMNGEWPYENPDQAWATFFNVESDVSYRNRRVLVVDDDQAVLDAIRAEMHDEYDVTTCAGGRAGLDMLTNAAPFAVIVSNLNLDSFENAKFFKDARRLDPNVVSIALAARADLNGVVQAFQEGSVFRFLTETRSADALNRALSQCLEQHCLIHTAKSQSEALVRSNKALQSLNAWLEDIAAARTATICQLHKFVTELTGLNAVDAVGELVVNTAAGILKCRRVSLMLPDDNREHLKIAAATGLSGKLIEQTSIPIGGLLPGRVFSESTSVIINQSDELPPPENRLDGGLFTRLPQASIPLATADETVGVLNLCERADSRPFTEECQADMRALADAAAIAIHNLIRMRERDEARDATIVALAKLAENRDPETGAHLERVQHFCRILAEGLSATPGFHTAYGASFIEDVARSSILHDIGKVGVPDRILLKPGKLTAAEFEIMKQHTIIGGDTIRPAVGKSRRPGFLRMGMEIAYCHHEKIDGSGYPYGLVGDEIPLSARIMAVADVYDALTSRRVYKSSLSHEKALEIIRSGSGVHFDAALVNVLVERQDDFKHAAEALRDDDNTHVGVNQANAEQQSLNIGAAVSAQCW